MNDKPIIFSAPMVRAILEGRKTQTRRILKPQPASVCDKVDAVLRYRIGDLLWVRESIIKTPAGTAYVADGADHYGAGGKLRATPSIHMPRSASRITLRVTGVKVERLQDISEADAIAEGLEPNIGLSGWRCYLPEPKSQDYWLSPIESFRTLWESIHGPGSWGANPWCVAIEFEPIFMNIDQVERADGP